MLWFLTLMFKRCSKLEKWKEEGGKNREKCFFYKAKNVAYRAEAGPGWLSCLGSKKNKQTKKPGSYCLLPVSLTHSIHIPILDIFFYIHTDRSTKLWHCCFMVSEYSFYMFGLTAVMSAEGRKLVDMSSF